MNTTITVKESTKRELLKFISKLQIKLGRKVDFDEALRFLLMKERKKNPHLLLEACSPTENSEEILRNLREEQKKDERGYSRYFSS